MKKNELVYQIVNKIPKGKVMTYGQVSRELRIKNHQLRVSAQMVGWFLHANKSKDVPCHRVVDRNGRIAANFGFGGAIEQKRRLEAESVAFIDENHVDMDRSS